MTSPQLPPVPNSPASSRHARKVEHIVAQLRAHRGVRPLSLQKKTVAHQVPKAGDLRRGDDKIDVSALTEIVSIDPQRRICVAEAGVTFVDLVRATMKHGLVPIVVPELSTITVGGAVSGCSIESMSFVRGGFHDTCLAYEVITATGDVLTCTPDNDHRLLFQMMHGSFGTLGVLSQVTFELVPAKPFVHVVYERHATLADYQASIRRHTDLRDVDFMDGIIHSPTLWVLSVGRFVDRAPYTNRYDWLKVYYQSTAARREDYLRTPDYFFRYDRGVTNVNPKSFIGRLLFGRLMSSTRWLTIAEKMPWILRRRQPPITVDVFVPFSKVPDFMSWYERTIGHFPLWCVPYRRVHDYPWLAPSFWSRIGQDDLFLDIALYGMRRPPNRNVHREIEEKLIELGGIKTLIAENHYPRDEFWSIYDQGNYDAAKRIADPDNQFRDLYEKTCRATMGLS